MKSLITDEEMLARLLHRDGLVLVLDKPAGIPVHRGPKGGETLTDRLDALRFGLPNPPELAHRLDKDTSGCLVLGRHRKALAALGELFATGEVGKTYIAVVRGAPKEDAGRIELKLKKRSQVRGWWVAVDPSGQEAITDWRILERGETVSVIAASPLTGRTHQIRAHFAAAGFPVLGDRIYGREPAPPTGPILHLHSRRIVLPMSKKGPLDVRAPLPAHIKTTLQSLNIPAEKVEQDSDKAFS